jgi:hypothetical protein
MKPVTIRSKPKTILEAFKASPYWKQLTRPQQKQAAANPAEWLKGHPYLFFWHPTFFRDLSGRSLLHLPINLWVIVKTRQSISRKRKAKHR